MSSLLFLPSVQQTVALPAVRQMSRVATPTRHHAAVIRLGDRRAGRSPGAARRAVARALRRTTGRLAPATR